MSDRYNGFYVVFKEPISKGRAKLMKESIELFIDVASVSYEGVENFDSDMIREQVRREFREILWKALSK